MVALSLESLGIAPLHWLLYSGGVRHCTDRGVFHKECLCTEGLVQEGEPSWAADLLAIIGGILTCRS